MLSSVEFDVKDVILSNGSFGPSEISQLYNVISEDFSQYSSLKEAVSELASREDRTPATAVRLGVAYYLMGRTRNAIETLSRADGGALAHFYLAKAHFDQHEYDSAKTSYGAAKTAGYNSDQCALGVAECLRHEGNLEGALKTLDDLSGAVEQTAEYLFQRACTVSALGASKSEVIALLERAVQSNGNHAGALFGLALENDRAGNDDTALDLYSRAASRFPAHVGSLLNLGILHEDRQQYERAQQCYRRILEVFPGHERARLFLQDAMASSDMYYDEEAQKRRDRMTQVLSIPVSDFELSVRSRNCLQKMGIMTLGDLARCSEQELLSSKNFGETSLDEIREMLTSKGLQLGQLAHEKAEPEPTLDLSNLSADEQAVLERPIAELNLSVRARKCMVRLGLTTIGELIRKTGDDLLECKNFGVTSLNEVREKLTPMGLKLRGD
jgi:DNA-directed RNA polymerase subunit alpha